VQNGKGKYKTASGIRRTRWYDNGKLVKEECHDTSSSSEEEFENFLGDKLAQINQLESSPVVINTVQQKDLTADEEASAELDKLMQEMEGLEKLDLEREIETFNDMEDLEKEIEEGLKLEREIEKGLKETSLDELDLDSLRF